VEQEPGLTMKLLVIEDSQRLLRSLGTGLRKMGHVIDLVADGQEGFDYARFNEYDVIVLDLLLPGMDGLTILQKLRAMGNTTHVLILSAKDRVEDRVRGLELGADDYLVKPFSFDELCARLNTLQRRRHSAKNPEITLGSLTLNTASKQVKRKDRLMELTPGEYAILESLALNRGQVLSKEKLQDQLHNSDAESGVNVIEVMICNLRKKLSNGSEENIIRTRRGYGYLIE